MCIYSFVPKCQKEELHDLIQSLHLLWTTVDNRPMVVSGNYRTLQILAVATHCLLHSAKKKNPSFNSHLVTIVHFSGGMFHLSKSFTRIWHNLQL